MIVDAQEREGESRHRVIVLLSGEDVLREPGLMSVRIREQFSACVKSSRQRQQSEVVADYILADRGPRLLCIVTVFHAGP